MILAGEGPVGGLNLLQRGIAADVQRGVVVLLLSAPGRRRSPPECGEETGPSAGVAGEAEPKVELVGCGSRRGLAEGAGEPRRRVWIRGEEERGGGHGNGIGRPCLAVAE